MVKAVCGVLVLVVIAVAVISGAASAIVAEFDAETLRARIESWGVFGPVGYLLIMWLVQPFGVPGFVFMVPASVVWNTPAAIVLSWVGNMGASWIAFEFTRRVGRDWVETRIPDRVRRYDDRLTAGGIWPIVLLRLVTGQLPAADWLLGVSSVRRSDFLIGTGIGIVPGIIVIVVYGADLLSWLAARPGPSAVAVLFVAFRIGFRRLRR